MDHTCCWTTGGEIRRVGLRVLPNWAYESSNLGQREIDLILCFIIFAMYWKTQKPWHWLRNSRGKGSAIIEQKLPCNGY